MNMFLRKNSYFSFEFSAKHWLCQSPGEAALRYFCLLASRSRMRPRCDTREWISRGGSTLRI